MRPSLEVLSGTLAALSYLQYLGTQSNDPLAEAAGGVIWCIPSPLLVQGAAVNDVTEPLPVFTTGAHMVPRGARAAFTAAGRPAHTGLCRQSSLRLSRVPGPARNRNWTCPG